MISTSREVVKIVSLTDGCTMWNVTKLDINGQSVFKADLSITLSMYGQEKVCFQALDIARYCFYQIIVIL